MRRGEGLWRSEITRWMDGNKESDNRRGKARDPFSKIREVTGRFRFRIWVLKKYLTS